MSTVTITESPCELPGIAVQDSVVWGVTMIILVHPKFPIVTDTSLALLPKLYPESVTGLFTFLVPSICVIPPE